MTGWAASQEFFSSVFASGNTKKDFESCYVKPLDIIFEGPNEEEEVLRCVLARKIDNEAVVAGEVPASSPTKKARVKQVSISCFDVCLCVCVCACVCQMC
jgi:hypothetical protein